MVTACAFGHAGSVLWRWCGQCGAVKSLPASRFRSAFYRVSSHKDLLESLSPPLQMKITELIEMLLVKYLL